MKNSNQPGRKLAVVLTPEHWTGRGGAGAHDRRQQGRGAREDTVADRGLLLGRLVQASADAGDGRPPM
jgi:hypothetical protein